MPIYYSRDNVTTRVSPHPSVSKHFSASSEKHRQYNTTLHRVRFNPVFSVAQKLSDKYTVRLETCHECAYEAIDLKLAENLHSPYKNSCTKKMSWSLASTGKPHLSYAERLRKAKEGNTDKEQQASPVLLGRGSNSHLESSTQAGITLGSSLSTSTNAMSGTVSPAASSRETAESSPNPSTSHSPDLTSNKSLLNIWEVRKKQQAEKERVQDDNHAAIQDSRPDVRSSETTQPVTSTSVLPKKNAWEDTAASVSSTSSRVALQEASMEPSSDTPNGTKGSQSNGVTSPHVFDASSWPIPNLATTDRRAKGASNSTLGQSKPVSLHLSGQSVESAEEKAVKGKQWIPVRFSQGGVPAGEEISHHAQNHVSSQEISTALENLRLPEEASAAPAMQNLNASLPSTPSTSKFSRENRSPRGSRGRGGQKSPRSDEEGRLGNDLPKGSKTPDKGAAPENGSNVIMPDVPKGPRHRNNVRPSEHYDPAAYNHYSIPYGGQHVPYFHPGWSNYPPYLAPMMYGQSIPPAPESTPIELGPKGSSTTTEPTYKLLTQIEFYFSHTNLQGDFFLRKNMNEEGFVLLSFVASFNRVKNLAGADNVEVIRDTLLYSSVLQLNDNRTMVRKTHGWQTYVLGEGEQPQQDTLPLFANAGPPNGPFPLSYQPHFYGTPQLANGNDKRMTYDMPPYYPSDPMYNQYRQAVPNMQYTARPMRRNPRGGRGGHSYYTHMPYQGSNGNGAPYHNSKPPVGPPESYIDPSDVREQVRGSYIAIC